MPLVMSVTLLFHCELIMLMNNYVRPVEDNNHNFSENLEMLKRSPFKLRFLAFKKTAGHNSERCRYENFISLNSHVSIYCKSSTACRVSVTSRGGEVNVIPQSLDLDYTF